MPTRTTIPASAHSDYLSHQIQEAHVHSSHNSLSLNASSHTIIIWILIGLVAGYITGKLMKGSGFGPIMDIVVGIVGALVGGFLMVHLGYAGSGGFLYTVFVAVLGAVILTFLLRLVTGGRSRNL